MKNKKTPLLCLLFCCLTLPLCYGQAAGGEESKAYVFKFVAGNDMFYTPWNSNGENLEKLYSVIDEYRQDILSGAIPVHVDGYCTSGNDQQTPLQLAKIRSNRVKSELIIAKGLREAHFVTRNHATPYGTERNVVVVSIPIPVRDAPAPRTPEPQPEDQPAPADAPRPEPRPEREPEPVSQPEPVVTTRSWATFSLRANLLHWATLTPDLGIEWRPSANFGVVLHGTWAHWDWKDNERHFRLWKIEPEARYYAGVKKNGYLGVAFRTGQFNVKTGTMGTQSDFTGGGLTGGYQLNLNNSFSLDFSLGAGYFHLKEYQKYTYINGVNVNKEKRNRGYWGIDHVGVTLIWKMVK